MKLTGGKMQKRKKHYRKTNLTQHHLIPKSRKTRDKQVIMLYWEHHQSWHNLFGDLTLQEIIAVLQRIEKQHYE
jgi:hypothetical protein